MDDHNLFRIHIQKKDPKENPPTYQIKTVEDISMVVNSENIDRFLEDFEAVLRVYVATEDLAMAVSEEVGARVNNRALKMTEFTWIDD